MHAWYCHDLGNSFEEYDGKKFTSRYRLPKSSLSSTFWSKY